jgi:serine/threonine protein kinase
LTVDVDSHSESVARARSARLQEPRSTTALERSRWADEPLPLDKIGRYTILGQIAGGGMGSVFVALMRGPAQFSRLVAIKCLRTRWLDDPKYVERFTTEVKLSARIRHPNVVQTLDVVEEAGELFLVMEYVDGVTLSALLSDASRFERPLPIAFGLAIMASVLRGLHAAHETSDENGAPLNIVHRDVSPQNIMLSRNGHVQVLDFGAAKAVDHSQNTAAGVLVGKLAYMAPEQVRGERSSPGSDVFAAGVVLWEALVGKRLFYDPGLARGELLHALVLKPVQRPGALRPGVPAAVDEVVGKALERNPRRRYQTALEFAMALEAAGVAAGYPPLASAAIGSWVSEVCATRLADKDALLRSGMAAAAMEGSGPTPVPHALVLPSQQQQTLPGFVLASPPRPLRSSRSALAVSGLLLLGCLWASWDRLASLVQSSLGGGAAARSATGASARALEGDATPSATLPNVTPPAVASERAAAAAVAREPSEVESGAAPMVARSAVAGAPVSGARPARGVAAPGKRPRRPTSFAEARARSAEPARTPGCDPPTYMDAAGIRHFKRDCL